MAIPCLPFRSAPVLALGAILLLGACRSGDVVGQLDHALDEERLGEETGGAVGAAEAREAVHGTREHLAEIRRDLRAHPDGAAGPGVDEALAAVDDALMVAHAALDASDAIASGGLISFASMQAAVDPLVTRLDEAKGKVDSALEDLDNVSVSVDSTTEVLTTLTEASNLLASLKTALSTELEEARTRRALALPDGLDATLTAGTFTIAAGMTTVRSGTQAGGSAVEFRCPAGNDACRVRVYANGEIGYWGGAPVAWPSPARSALWAGVEPGVRRASGPTELTINRVKRLNPTNTAANPSRLAVATVPVAYSVTTATATTTTVTRPTGELPLRAVTVRGNGTVQGGHFHDAGPWSSANPWKTSDANLESSIELREDGGVVLKVRGTAGEGLIYGDMGSDPDVPAGAGPDGKQGDRLPIRGRPMTPVQAAELGVELPTTGSLPNLTLQQALQLWNWSRDNCNITQATVGLCYDRYQEDLEITFGKSSGDPERDTAAYWSARVPFGDPDNVRTPFPPAIDRDYHDYGRYDLYVSKYAGLDPGADAGSTADDTPRYLEYAAYGLFRFLDNRLVKPRPGRIQGFHFGFDAFRDVAGSRTTDAGSLATTALKATFKGRAMGWDLRDGAELNARYYLDPGASTPGSVGPMVRLRGDVTLNACIGGSGDSACTGTGVPNAANTINGVIDNFELYLPDTDSWAGYDARDLSRVALKGASAGQTATPIGADGSFRGVAQADPSYRWGPTGVPDREVSDYIEFGEYSGALYGPRGAGMEAAGWWRAVADPRPASPGTTQSLGLVGSFGAKCTAGCAPPAPTPSPPPSPPPSG